VPEAGFLMIDRHGGPNTSGACWDGSTRWRRWKDSGQQRTWRFSVLATRACATGP
jgi:hypothetical protein